MMASRPENVHDLRRKRLEYFRASTSADVFASSVASCPLGPEPPSSPRRRTPRASGGSVLGGGVWSEQCGPTVSSARLPELSSGERPRRGCLGESVEDSNGCGNEDDVFSPPEGVSTAVRSEARSHRSASASESMSLFVDSEAAGCPRGDVEEVPPVEQSDAESEADCEYEYVSDVSMLLSALPRPKSADHRYREQFLRGVRRALEEHQVVVSEEVLSAWLSRDENYMLRRYLVCQERNAAEVRPCPQCHYQNEAALRWCFNCGVSIMDVCPAPLEAVAVEERLSSPLKSPIVHQEEPPPLTPVDIAAPSPPAPMAPSQLSLDLSPLDTVATQGFDVEVFARDDKQARQGGVPLLRLCSSSDDDESQSVTVARTALVVVHPSSPSWLSLPDELWLHVLRGLPPRGLCACARTCRHLHRLAADSSLWRVVDVSGMKLRDEWLSAVGRVRPRRLVLSRCDGTSLSASALRGLFQQCAATLQEVNVSECSGGPLSGDNVLMHLSVRSPSLLALNAGWTDVSGEALVAVTDVCSQMERLYLNGCQKLRADALIRAVRKRGESLRELELSDCLQLDEEVLLAVAECCPRLTRIAIGHAFKAKPETLTTLCRALPHLLFLNLTRCQQLTDDALQMVVHSCPRVRTLLVAGCDRLTDASMQTVAESLPGLHVFSVKDCRSMSDQGVRHLVRHCRHLRSLDLSSTAITAKSVSAIASYLCSRLQVLKLSFVAQLPEAVLLRLVNNCRRLKEIHLFGLKNDGLLEQLAKLKPGLDIRK